MRFFKHLAIVDSVPDITGYQQLDVSQSKVKLVITRFFPIHMPFLCIPIYSFLAALISGKIAKNVNLRLRLTE